MELLYLKILILYSCVMRSSSEDSMRERCEDEDGYFIEDWNLCLAIVDKDKKWENGQKECMKLAKAMGEPDENGRLAHMESEEKQEKIKDAFYADSTSWPDDEYWLGFHDVDTNCTWRISSVNNTAISSQGCYAQNAFQNYTDVTSEITGSLTDYNCIKKCEENSIYFAILTEGSNCLCADDIDDDGLSTSGWRDCNMTCPGNSSVDCGGVGYGSVHIVSGLYLPAPFNQDNFDHDEECAAVFWYSEVPYIETDQCGNNYGFLCKSTRNEDECVTETVDGGQVSAVACWQNISKTCYYHSFNSWNSYHSCRQFCKEVDAILAPPVYDYDAAVGNDEFLACAWDSGGDVWVGVSCDQYTWVDNDDSFGIDDILQYANWASGYPQGADNDCGTIDEDQQMRNRDCSEKRWSLCEIAMADPTTAGPTTTAETTTSDITEGTTPEDSTQTQASNNGETPDSNASTLGDDDTFGTFEIIMLIIIIILLIAIIIAIIIFCKYKSKDDRKRVKADKFYDGRPEASSPDSDEIYLPPSKTGSTAWLTPS